MIGIYIFYGKYISEPFADFKAFQNIKIEGQESPPIDLNTYALKRDELKKDVLDKMDKYLKDIKQKKEDYNKNE